ncbi:MAG: CRISPR-associated protein Cas4 [Ignavibacteriae bacterium]|nr:CRISPR-associated protein Cas4 [Ignavibacteriota bacterium]NOG98570.1 CRISPR-associated protein Cas4 [Ignavibacteriota bacterium]
MSRVMHKEEEFIMISALQHYIYCPRQCGLIHVDDVWQENLYTTRGNLLHEKVDTDTYETRGNIKTVRGLRIHSYKYGIVGRCDVVEFNNSTKENTVLPVEYKAGKPKNDFSDKIQLCAQAICLEEMLSVKIKRAEFYYAKIRRREKIEIDEELRKITSDTITAVREIVDNKKIPREEYSSKCKNCSLQQICQPKLLNRRKVENYIKGLYTP